MARLVIRVPGGAGFGTEALAIAHNSLGDLHLAGATRAGTGRRRSHRQQTTLSLIDEYGKSSNKNDQSRDNSRKYRQRFSFWIQLQPNPKMSNSREIDIKAKAIQQQSWTNKDRIQQTIKTIINSNQHLNKQRLKPPNQLTERLPPRIF